MRILLDTNIIIGREDNKIIDEDLQILMKILNQLDISIILHKKSIEDIERDKNEERKQITLSKFKTYNLLEEFPKPSKDTEFLDLVGEIKKPNDIIDNCLLYAVYRNAVNFLITEDIGIHKKAKNLDISDRILSILDAINLFEKEIPKEKIKLPYALKATSMSNLNLDDPIFDTLKDEYPGFNEWFIKKAREGRNCWVYYKNGEKLGAVLIYKFEKQEIAAKPILPKKKRLKITTMIVSYTGQKIGELFLKLSINLAIKNQILEIYLTHFSKENDSLVALIEDFGFTREAIIEQEWSEIPEDVFVKKILISNEEVQLIEPIQVSKQYFPNFYDGVNVKKHIIPIQPKYHNRLFTDFPRRGQLTINESINEFVIEGNTIRKAYITHSSTKKIDPGDVILFYRSEDMKEIVSVGVVEKVQYDLLEKEQVFNLVGKRTVYSLSEIEKFVKKPTTIILFNHHFYLRNPVSYDTLLNKNLLKGPPQSITEIDHKKYLIIKEVGRINERFTFS
ncbi:MAG: GNAT family N-acetyltransferase [Promethearchaeota archaeon]